jgi:hypothetical protein
MSYQAKATGPFEYHIEPFLPIWRYAIHSYVCIGKSIDITKISQSVQTQKTSCY